jgi:enoyl-[acyl-carrier-protein] reductase (NADH)
MSAEEAEATIPLGKPAHADEIGNVCAFLLSDLASHITAQEIVVDGGYSVGKSVQAGYARRS